VHLKFTLALEKSVGVSLMHDVENSGVETHI